MKKCSFKELGSRVFLAWGLGKESEQNFFSLSPPEQGKVLGLLTEYISRQKNARLSTSEAYERIHEVCSILATEHPFSYCSRKCFEKYLGYNHCFQLVYSWAFEKITLSWEKFSVALTERQTRLFDYQKELLLWYCNFSAEGKTSFIKQKRLIEKQLFERNYADLKITIVSFEQVYDLTESLYAIVDSVDETDQIKGMFNAIVSTYSWVDGFYNCKDESKR
ncbi:MAG: hypothetical protein LBG52_07745 [Candidatus Peribacteria bacterium]|jgi:hypothetical protein|nr:hypothetical protein [Candidatus Peribacteria bacterium]